MGGRSIGTKFMASKMINPLKAGRVPSGASFGREGKALTNPEDIRNARMNFYSALNKVSRGEVFWDESDNLIKMKPKQVAKQMTKSQPKTLGTTRRSGFHRNPAVRREMYGDMVLGAGKDLV